MTIDGAIKRLQESINEIGGDEEDTLTKAEKLGIEALKRVKRYRPRDWKLLPGETKK